MVSSSTLAALPVDTSVNSFTSRPPNIIEFGDSPLQVLGYVDAAVVVSDVEVRHPLVVVSELAFQLMIGIDILRPYRTSCGCGTPDFLRFNVDRCSMYLKERVPITPHRDVAARIVSVFFDTTLPLHAESRNPVHLPPTMLGDSSSVVKPLPRGLASITCAVFSAVCATTGVARVCCPWQTRQRSPLAFASTARSPPCRL